MRTLRRLLYGEIFFAVSMVTLGFLGLLFFFDLVEELQSVARHASTGYDLPKALVYVGLLLPSHLYELLPIAVLIGTIYVMARLAQSSEYTILRTSGLGPGRALRALLSLGAAFVVLTFTVGDYAAPWSDRSAQLLKARYTGRITIGQTGAWLKEKQLYSQYAVNIGELGADAELKDVRLFEFDNRGLLMSITQARTATVDESDAWLLHDVHRTDFPSGRTTDVASIDRTDLPTLRWPNKITGDMVSAALLKPERMNTYDLFRYIRHLQDNAQTAQRYEIEFWKKVFYPLSCLVMVVLALPFAYLHFRAAGLATYVFGGVMAGISFFLLTNVFGYMGHLQNWEPWLTAALPGMIYSVFSLTAFAWLVFKR